MNYRHAYHAGNFADVLKHVVLTATLEHLARKGVPYFYLDTHGEYRDGILRLIDAPAPPPAVGRYLDLVRELGYEQGHLVAYPGSPRIALAMLRGSDRAALCELEPREADALKALVRGDPRAQLHERDGYEALIALVPPRERRGLVLIDPPYELPDEYERLEQALLAALARWPSGVYAVWYPIKAGAADGRFLARMAASGVRRQLVAELTVERDDSPGGLNGAGMLIVNPPWQLDERLAAALPWLHRKLAAEGRGRCRVSWLVPE
jgi:23S rRNA (adenine2030-N6)-methyltransferase